MTQGHIVKGGVICKASSLTDPICSIFIRMSVMVDEQGRCIVGQERLIGHELVVLDRNRGRASYSGDIRAR